MTPLFLSLPLVELHELLESVLSTIALSRVEEQLRSVVLLAFGHEQSRLAKLCSMSWPVEHVDAGAMQAALNTLHGHLLCAYVSKAGRERASNDPNYNLEQDTQLLAFLTELTNLQNNDLKPAAAAGGNAATAPAHSSSSGAPAATAPAANVPKPRLTPAQQFQRAASTNFQQQQAARGSTAPQAAATAIQSSLSHDADRSRSTDHQRAPLLGPRPSLPSKPSVPSTSTPGNQSTAARQGPEPSRIKRESPIVPGAQPHVPQPPHNTSSGSSSSTTSTPLLGAGSASESAASKPRAPSLLQSTPSPAVHSSSPLLPTPTSAFHSGNNSSAARAANASTSQQNHPSGQPDLKNQTSAAVGVASSAAGDSTTPPPDARSVDSTDATDQKPPASSESAPQSAEEKPAQVEEELPLGPPGLRFKKFAYSNSLEFEAN